jgi:integrase
MPTTHFTDAKISKLNLPEGKGQVDYFETKTPGRSLILTLNRSGRRTWSVLFYERGKPTRKKLGEFPALNCKQAWEEVRVFDVAAALTSIKAGSFKEVAENWFKRHVEGKLRSERELRRHLEKYVYPDLAQHQFAEIRRSHITGLLDKIEDKNGKCQADAVLATIRGIMGWYQSRDDNYTSPIAKGMRRDKRRPDAKSRKRILDDEEIRAVWSAASELGGSFGAIMKLCLLTAQRREKIAQMRWGDVDEEKGIWIIATEDGEKGNPGVLHLPQMAVDIISPHPALVGNPYVFASARSRKCHFNSWSQGKRELDELLPVMPHWVIHDLRRTARSLMSRVGVQTEIAERVLGHKQPGIIAVYDRHKYEDEMGKALRRLEAEIERIVNPEEAKVVALPVSGRRKGDMS